MRPRTFCCLAAASLALTIGGGCSSSRTRKVVTKSGEPPLVVGGVDTPEVAEAPPVKTVTLADRHPLFSRPRQYYDKTNSNKLGKTAAATFVGIPAGFVGEIRQIVTGRPTVPVDYSTRTN